VSDAPAGSDTGTTHPDRLALVGVGLSKRFGSLQVLDNVNFEVGAAEAVGIVGPNGAGKTTLLNVLSGSLAPSAGTVHLGTEDITHMRSEQRCRRGVGRAFQIPRPFGAMTVLENVLVGASYGAGLSRSAAYDKSVEVLELCGLIDLANRRAESLGLLHRKRLELARSLATDPQVLLLDEIGGGLTDAEAAQLVDTIRRVRARGISIVWIEHIVHLLLQVIDRLVAMDAGRVIASGKPDVVLRDTAVVDAYLGKAGP
jgi:branched-chain amino acid transport system ATP-binding protein